jgi:hypothetical protein
MHNVSVTVLKPGRKEASRKAEGLRPAKGKIDRSEPSKLLCLHASKSHPSKLLLWSMPVADGLLLVGSIGIGNTYGTMRDSVEGFV